MSGIAIERPDDTSEISRFVISEIYDEWRSGDAEVYVRKSNGRSGYAYEPTDRLDSGILAGATLVGCEDIPDPGDCGDRNGISALFRFIVTRSTSLVENSDAHTVVVLVKGWSVSDLLRDFLLLDGID